MTTALAHPNIALVKYWGKANVELNEPATPSLSITLDELATRTRVKKAASDHLTMNGEPVADAKVSRFLSNLRDTYEVPPLEISTSNNFPTGAGLASSASGFAALITAINSHCGLGLGVREMSQIARQGSASAARSMVSGFAALTGPQWAAAPVEGADAWDLRVVIAITTSQAKAIGSTEGMEISRSSSPYFDAWTQTTAAHFEAAQAAVRAHDFAALASVAEASCMAMHALMISSQPSLLYWNDATVRMIHALRAAQADGLKAFLTIDAGPQVKMVCQPEAAPDVTALAEACPGVQQVVSCGLGAGARIVGDD